jgi:hypothetical protein
VQQHNRGIIFFQQLAIERLKMKQFTISENLINGIIGYLGEKPYKETFLIINAIQNELKAQDLPTIPPELQPQPDPNPVTAADILPEVATDPNVGAANGAELD